MSDKNEARRAYIEGDVKEKARAVLDFLREGSLDLPVKVDDLIQARLYFDGREITIEDGLDGYTTGRNIGRLIIAYANPGLANSLTMQAEKIRKVVYHLFGIVYLRMKDPEANIDDFPSTYPSANDDEMPFSLRETRREKMERLTGKPIDIPDTPPQNEDDKGQKKEFFLQEDKALPPERADDLDDLVDPEEDDNQAYLAERKEDNRFDPNQTTDFGYGSEVSDLGHEEDERDRRVRDEVDAVIFDREDSSRRGKMSEEFRAARTIFLGRRDGENWQTVLQNLLLSDEQTSITYLKGIYNY